MKVLRLLFVLIAFQTIIVFGDNIFGETIHVDKTFNSQSFDYSIEFQEQKDGYTIWRLSYPTPELKIVSKDRTILARLFLPNDWKPGDRPRRSVVSLDILGGDGSVAGLIGAHFANRGFPVLLPVLPYIGERADRGESFSSVLKKPRGVLELADAFEQVIPELRRSVDLLLARPESDDTKVHLVGTSMGAIMSCGLAGSDDRIDKIALLVGGGNLRGILDSNIPNQKMLQNIFKGISPEEMKRIDRAVDRVEPMTYVSQLLKKAKADQIRMYNAENDEVIDPKYTKELADAIGMKEKIRIFPNVGHFSAITRLSEIVPEITEFFLDATVPKKNNSKIAQKAVSQRIASALSDLIDFETDGFFDTTARVKVSFGKPRQTVDFEVHWIRADDRFRIDVKAAEGTRPFGSNIRNVSLGWNRVPWIQAENGSILWGTKDPTGKKAGELVPNRLKTQYQMLLGMLALLKMQESPDLLRGATIQKRLQQAGKFVDVLRYSKKGINVEIQIFSDREALHRIQVVHEQSGTEVDVAFELWTRNDCSSALAPLFVPQGNRLNLPNDEINQYFENILDLLSEQLPL